MLLAAMMIRWAGGVRRLFVVYFRGWVGFIMIRVLF